MIALQICKITFSTVTTDEVEVRSKEHFKDKISLAIQLSKLDRIFIL